MLQKLLVRFPSLRLEQTWHASGTGPKSNRFGFTTVGQNLTLCKNKWADSKNIVKQCWQSFWLHYIWMSHLWYLYMFADICILTIQRGKICVCVFPTWGHIDAAFRLLAFEYVSVGIEGRTTQTGSHLNKQAQLIIMLLESGFLFPGPMYLFFISLWNTSPKLHELYLERQTSNQTVSCFVHVIFQA